MIKKLSLRWRMTLLSSILIAVCCIGLSIVLNISAFLMIDGIAAMPMSPAQSTDMYIPDDTMFDSQAQQIATLSSEEAKQVKNDYLSGSMVYTVIAVLLGGMLTYYVSGKAMEPIKKLNEQIKNVNAHNLNESLEAPPTNDELAELTTSFNDMTDKLAKVFAMQKRFSADAAHELRTPLAVLQTKLDVFRKKKEHTTEEYEALTIVFQKQVSRLRNVVTELLEIANMEHELQKQNISLDLLLNDVVNDLKLSADEKNIALALESADFFVLGDYDLLYRAFFNIVENAIKYNLPNGKIEIKAVKIEKGAVLISVSDTGPGIPDDMKKQIFEPFFRVDKSRSREMGGAGLGLSLTESIVKKHGGKIEVTDNDGGGSCFTVTLPIE